MLITVEALRVKHSPASMISIVLQSAWTLLAQNPLENSLFVIFISNLHL